MRFVLAHCTQMRMFVHVHCTQVLMRALSSNVQRQLPLAVEIYGMLCTPVLFFALSLYSSSMVLTSMGVQVEREMEEVCHVLPPRSHMLSYYVCRTFR